jgi:hypothetical protein
LYTIIHYTCIIGHSQTGAENKNYIVFSEVGIGFMRFEARQSSLAEMVRMVEVHTNRISSLKEYVTITALGSPVESSDQFQQQPFSTGCKKMKQRFVFLQEKLRTGI